MKLHRIKASALHSIYHLNHSMETWVDLFWFSFTDILLFGLISTFFAKTSGDAQFLLAGIIIWEVLRVGQYTISVGMLWEVWSKSFSSLFISPLTLSEFIIGQAIAGLVKSSGVTLMVCLVARILFGFNVLDLGLFNFIIYFLVVFTFAIAAGIFILSLIIRFGTNIQSLAWGFIFILQPFSAIFFPIETLPEFLRPFSYLSPVTYVMQSIRSQLSGGEVLWPNIAIAFLLTLFYLIIVTFYTSRVLLHSKSSGSFARMGS